MLQPFATDMLTTIALMRIFVLTVFGLYMWIEKDTTKRFIALLIALFIPNVFTVGLALVGP